MSDQETRATAFTATGLRLSPDSIPRWCRELGRVAVFVAVFSGQTNVPLVASAAKGGISAEIGRLKGAYEPSGVHQLSNGKFLIVEDEARTPFALLAFDSQGEPELRRLNLSAQVGSRIQLNDLEGIAPGESGYIYAITSHSRNRAGGRDPSREWLVRLKIADDRLTDLAVLGGLRGQIVDHLTALESFQQKSSKWSSGGLNIEGLAFDPAESRLMIGLRSPVVEGKALIFTINNPAANFAAGSTPIIEAEHLQVDLDGGGIRGLAFDPVLQGFLILSRSEQAKGNNDFKLWLWKGDQAIPPKRLRLASAADLESAEGVAPARINGVDKILVVRDDGSAAKGKSAHCLVLDYPEEPLPSERR